jgi:glycosyltransferase involved in cell wall biosynthesis
VISIIVPTMNEERIITTTLRALLAEPTPHEILVVDGGSIDRTVEVARSFGPVRVVVQEPDGPAGRGSAYNQAACLAAGEILLFLHADVRLPPGGLGLVQAALADAEVVGGGFVATFGGAGRGLSRILLRLDELVWATRTRLFRWFAGDQAPFVRREAFLASGGYPPIRLAEDWALADLLRGLGRLAVIKQPVTVSPRRFLANGVLKTIAVTLSVEMMYRIGASPRLLRWWYRRWLPHER